MDIGITGNKSLQTIFTGITLRPTRGDWIFAVGCLGFFALALVFGDLSGAPLKIPSLFLAMTALFAISKIIVEIVTYCLPWVQARRATALILLLLFGVTSGLFFVRLDKTIPISGVESDVLLDHREHAERIGLSDAVFDSDKKFMVDGHVDLWAYLLYENGMQRLPWRLLPVAEKGMAYIYAAIFTVVRDYHPIYILIFLVAVKAIGGLLILLLAIRGVNHTAAAVSALIYLLLPEGILWDAMLHKDGLIICLILLTLLSSVAMGVYRTGWQAALVSFSLVALCYTRSGVVIPLCCGVLATTLVLNVPVSKKMIRLATIVGTTALLFLVMPHVVRQEIVHNTVTRVVDKLCNNSSTGLDIQNLTYTDSVQNSLVNSVGGGDMNIRKLHFLPVRILMIYMTPFPPCKIIEPVYWWIASSSWLYWIMSPFVMLGLYRFALSRDPVHYSVIIFLGVLAVAIVFAGPMVLDRYRLMSLSRNPDSCPGSRG